MKILVVSDTHGHTKNLERVLEKVGDIDLFIHCGDLEGGEDYIRALVDVPCYMVAGNNAWLSDLQREMEISVDDYRIWITHGNNYGASMGPERLLEEWILTSFADLIKMKKNSQMQRTEGVAARCSSESPRLLREDEQML